MAFLIIRLVLCVDTYVMFGNARGFFLSVTKRNIAPQECINNDEKWSVSWKKQKSGDGMRILFVL